MDSQGISPQKTVVIAIDGPTASGKGTVAQRVADKLGYHYLDSGALYRLTALSVLRAGIAEDDVGAIASIAARLPCSFKGGSVFLGEEDVSEAIRTEEAGNMASKVAAHQPVRDALVALQLSFCQPPGLVADGRDMGTVIFPNADAKVFLTASVEVRAQRRYKQLLEKGFSANIDILRKDLEERDRRDSERKSSPLKPAADAVILDSSDLGIEESVQAILDICAKKNIR